MAKSKGANKGPMLNKMPSKAQREKEDRHWRAEGLVKDAFCQTPEFKQATRKAERVLAKADTAIKGVLKKGK